MYRSSTVTPGLLGTVPHQPDDGAHTRTRLNSRGPARCLHPADKILAQAKSRALGLGRLETPAPIGYGHRHRRVSHAKSNRGLLSVSMADDVLQRLKDGGGERIRDAAWHHAGGQVGGYHQQGLIPHHYLG
jgi:hypothetical protein